MERYGPPPDPREIPFAAGFSDAPGAWVLCVLLGAVLFGLGWRRSRLIGAMGLVTLLTAPMFALIPSTIYGAFPTIDKYGSLAFYLDGVHWRLFSPDDPGLQLIGVHMGHHLVTAFFDLGLEPFAAVNAHAWLNLVLNLTASALLFEALGAPRLVAFALGLAFGLDLHVFRDLNWYTIEKSGVWWLPLYAWALLGASRDQPIPTRLAPLIYVGACFYNLYWGVLAAGLGAIVLVLARRRAVTIAVFGSAILALPLVYWQWRLMQGAAAPGDPERFISERAALDVLTLWPPAWNRLELWYALDPVALGVGLWGLTRRPWMLLVFVPFGVLALGPSDNPAYTGILELVPGFWRMAKPETFFQIAWLTLCASAAAWWGDRPCPPDRRWPAAVLLAAVLFWALMVRTHPVFPGFSTPIEVTLSGSWRAR